MFPVFFHQGLLKVAIDNARAQEKQVQLEKTELKMELFRERELRETLEKQLAVEQKNRGNQNNNNDLVYYPSFTKLSQNIKVLHSLYNQERWWVH